MKPKLKLVGNGWDGPIWDVGLAANATPWKTNKDATKEKNSDK